MNQANRLIHTSNQYTALEYALEPKRFDFLREEVAKLLPNSDGCCIIALMDKVYESSRTSMVQTTQSKAREGRMVS